MIGRPDHNPNDPFGFERDKNPPVEVTQEQLKERFFEWMAVIRANPGAPLLVTEKYNEHSAWDISIGLIRPSITDEELEAEVDKSPWFSQLEVTTAPTIWANTHGIKTAEDRTIRLGTVEVHKSFQTYVSYLGPIDHIDDAKPQLEVVVGNQAIAEWFSDSRHASNPYRYILACQQLGIEPHFTDEIIASIDHRRQEVILEILRRALENKNLKARMEDIYKTIGRGSVRVLSGIAFGTAPESEAEAALFTYDMAQAIEARDQQIQTLQEELLALGVDRYKYNETMARLLGVDLPVSIPDRI